MDASHALEQFVMGWETCCLKPHLDHGEWVVGWHHPMRPDEDIRVSISQDDADALFSCDIHRCADKVDHAIYPALKQWEFDALVSVARDIGCKAFASSLLRKRINGGYLVDAAEQFEACVGLHARRVAEREMFLHAIYDDKAVQ